MPHIRETAEEHEPRVVLRRKRPEPHATKPRAETGPQPWLHRRSNHHPAAVTHHPLPLRHDGLCVGRQGSGIHNRVELSVAHREGPPLCPHDGPCPTLLAPPPRRSKPTHPQAPGEHRVTGTRQHKAKRRRPSARHLLWRIAKAPQHFCKNSAPAQDHGTAETSRGEPGRAIAGPAGAVTDRCRSRSRSRNRGRSGRSRNRSRSRGPQQQPQPRPEPRAAAATEGCVSCRPCVILQSAPQDVRACSPWWGTEALHLRRVTYQDVSWRQ